MDDDFVKTLKIMFKLFQNNTLGLVFEILSLCRFYIPVSHRKDISVVLAASLSCTTSYLVACMERCKRQNSILPIENSHYFNQI